MTTREDEMYGHRQRPRWFQADELLRWGLSRHAGSAKVDLGRVVCLGEGTSRMAFAATADLTPDLHNLSGSYVALIAGPRADAEVGKRFAQEAMVLGAIAGKHQALRVPSVLGVRVLGETIGMVQSFLHGIPLDLRLGKQPCVVPWDVVAQVAAAVHTTSPPVELAGYLTWREHAEAALARCLPEEELEPELQDARAWALSHLPPPSASLLLHGDLLGQNILISPENLPALIDWEYVQLGDPAYDLAVVTRGARRPFQAEGGMMRLLDAYARASGISITEPAVRLHELCLLASWYRESRPSRATDGTAENTLRQLTNLLRRVSRF